MLPKDTEIGGSQRDFPTTHWSMLVAVRGEMADGHRAILNLLIKRYWKPVYCYIHRNGNDNEDAKDLTQEFFANWLQRDLFGRADPSRGRFRALLLTSLKNFLKNARRSQHAKRHRPAEGIISLDALIDDGAIGIEPARGETPESLFDRVWAKELVFRVLKGLEQECEQTGKQSHYLLFYRRIVAPAMEGATAPLLATMARELKMTEKEAANRLITARRAFQRLLREHISCFAASAEDVAGEVQDLFRFLSGE